MLISTESRAAHFTHIEKSHKYIVASERPRPGSHRRAIDDFRILFLHGWICCMPLSGVYQASRDELLQHSVAKILDAGTTAAVEIAGCQVVLLTSVGVKSGKLRKVPLMRVKHADEYAVVASRAGAPSHPDWYFNVKSHPHVELQDGSATNDYIAREVFGEEKALWWERAVATFPKYTEYQTATDREIPVLVLRASYP